MTDVIGYAGQIIEVIQALHGVYLRVKGLGKEIDDAMADCGNMETDVLSLKKLFDKQTSSKYPEQVQIITKEFKSLHKSIKKLKKLFREYERISLKWYGALVWAYDKPRESIMEILSGFASYRGIFTKALHIINEGHNKDQARQLKEMREQAKKASEERKKENLETKKKLKAMDERSKRDAERLEKMFRELMAANQATPENRSKAVEGWLVTEKGMGKEEAKSCASTALKEGRVPMSKTEDVSKPKKAEKDSGTIEDSAEKKKESKSKNDDAGQSSTTKAQSTKAKDHRRADPKIDKAALPEPSLPKLTPVSTPKEAKKPKSYSADDEKVVEVPKQKTSPKLEASKSDRKERDKERDKDGSPEAPVKKPHSVPPKGETPKPHHKHHEKSPAAPSKGSPPKSRSPNPDSKPPPRKPKVPVILIQDSSSTNKNNTTTTNNNKSRSPSPSPSTKSASSVTTTAATAGHRVKRSASVSTSKSSSEQERERIEKGMRYVKEGEKRGRSQDDRRRDRGLEVGGGGSGNGVGSNGGRRAKSEVRIVDVAGNERRGDSRRNDSSKPKEEIKTKWDWTTGMEIPVHVHVPKSGERERGK